MMLLMIIIVIILHLLSVLLLLSYARARWSDPGYVAGDWHKQPAAAALPAAAEEKQSLTAAAALEEGRQSSSSANKQRFCHVCMVPKPDRAHHCRNCARCVRRMDHHCFWLNNCVGYFNYRHFLLLIFYLFICTVYVFCILTSQLLFGRGEDISVVGYMILTGGWLISVFAILMAVSQLGVHGLLIVRNMSLIERRESSYDIERAAHLGLKPLKLHTWDHGNASKNFRIIMGPSPWLWLLPVNITPSDSPDNGYTFHTDANTQAKLAERAAQIESLLNRQYREAGLLPRAAQAAAVSTARTE